MSTRSQIIMQQLDGTYTGTYIHCDGYPYCRGMECLAAKLIGKYKKFVEYNRRDEDDEYTYYNMDQILEHARVSDLEYIYILQEDGTWTVIDISFRLTPDRRSFNNILNISSGDDDFLLDLIKKDARYHTDNVDEVVSCSLQDTIKELQYKL